MIWDATDTFNMINNICSSSEDIWRLTCSHEKQDFGPMRFDNSCYPAWLRMSRRSLLVTAGLDKSWIYTEHIQFFHTLHCIAVSHGLLLYFAIVPFVHFNCFDSKLWNFKRKKSLLSAHTDAQNPAEMNVVSDWTETAVMWLDTNGWGRPAAFIMGYWVQYWPVNNGDEWGHDRLIIAVRKI